MHEKHKYNNRNHYYVCEIVTYYHNIYNISIRKELTMIDRKCKFQYSGRNGNKCMEASYD